MLLECWRSSVCRTDSVNNTACNERLEMASRVFRVIQKIRFSVEQFEARLLEKYGGHPPLGPALAVQGPVIGEDSTQTSEGGFRSIFDGFLWAVPKHRRSIQRNRTRRRAADKLIAYVPKEKFTTCDVCGHTKLIGFLCGHCLIRIRQETEEIRKKVFEEETEALPETESIVLYEEETVRPEDEGKRIVEMKKKRPSWFSRSLTG